MPAIIMSTDGAAYHIHPKYKLYAASKSGDVVDIVKGKHQNESYFKVTNDDKTINYLTRQFVWECFNGLIPEGKEIVHINNNKKDNSIDNLKMISSDKSEDESEDESEKWRNHLQYIKNKKEREL